MTRYDRAPKGSLTGFDKIAPIEGGIDLIQTGWSISQLKSFLLNEDSTNFPTEDWVLKVDQLISGHLNDFDNPHNVTLNQIVGSFVGEILSSVTPGTPPSLAPFFSFDAVCALPLNDVFPASYSNTNMYRMNEGGMFINPSTEVTSTGVDYVNIEPGIPLFSSFTNQVPTDWATRAGVGIGTTVRSVSYPALSIPFQFYSVTETNASGSFGVSIYAAESLATVYTATFFIIPTFIGGSLLISQPGDTNNTMSVDLDDGTYTCSSELVKGETVVHPSGMLKISFSFQSDSVNAKNAVQIIHLNPNDASLNRIGQAGRALFSIGQPMVTRSTLNQPVNISMTTPLSTTPLVLSLDKVQAPPTISNLMITISINLYPTFSSASIVDTTILNFGALKITRDQTQIFVKLQDTTLFASRILDGLNIFSLSYSPTELIFKDLSNPRLSQPGVFPSLQTSSVSMGPCSGYLHHMALYAMSDKTRCVEYLTNG